MNTYIDKKYIELYVEYIESCGANVKKSTWAHIHHDTLINGGDYVSFSLIRSLKNEFSDITNAPEFPFRLGYHMGNNLNTHLEYLLRSCADIEDILTISNKFHHVRSNVMALDYQTNENGIELELLNIMASDDFILPMLFSSAALYHQFIKNTFNINNQILLTLFVESKKPDYFEKIENTVPFIIEFEHSKNRILFDSSLLSLRNPLYDNRLKYLLMNNVSEKLDHISPPDLFREQVKKLLIRSAPNYLNAEKTAQQLNISKRTLSRRLKQEGSTFIGILNDIRIVKAKSYLGQGMSIRDTADQLGYESCSSLINLLKKHPTTETHPTP
ncbi:hypothetical protein A9Q99_21300 [Gammaproteobacteria bacterium 45_16_T64]|nr:hypothetical protein A9Q99_21300 [Gammaproteobacteria bacterium 45_16_T64]